MAEFWVDFHVLDTKLLISVRTMPPAQLSARIAKRRKLFLVYSCHLQNGGEKYRRGTLNGVVSGVRALLRSLHPDETWSTKFVFTNMQKIESAGGVDAGFDVLADAPRSGRPRLTTPEEDERAMAALKADAKEHRELNGGLHMSCQALSSQSLAEHIGIPAISARAWRNRRKELGVKKLTHAKRDKGNFLRPRHPKNGM